MGVFDNFAHNLRKLCKQRGSIVQICKELGINRQQFSKYLSGDTFPRRKTLEQICAYFNVSEMELFIDRDHQLLSTDKRSINLMSDPVFQEILDELHKPQDMPLDDGLYLTYIRAHSEPEWVVRSVTSIRKAGETTQFRRLTGWAEQKSSLWRLSLGSHRGLVLNRRGFLYFGAMDSYASKAPTLAIMQWTPTEIPLLKGRCVALTKSGADVCDMVMEKLPVSTTLRAAIRKTGAVGVRESTLPLHIKQVLNNM